ncbi:MAG: SIMPL domain-containing protein [Neisseriaceae bacterium]|nr:SIMPL domain-containing protein [Neisseriaceae bacterium]
MKKKTLLLLLSLMAAHVQAESLNYNVVNLSAQATITVPRDMMEVELMIEESGNNRQTVSNRVTERSNQVLRKIRNNSALESQLSARHAYPIYQRNNQKPTWRDTARITVKSKDFAVLSQLIADVQSLASVGHLGFSVSRATQEKNDRQLTENAIQRFREQAQHITHALGGKTYKIIHLDVNRNHHYAVRNTGVRMMAKSASYDEAVTPEVESGEEELRAEVSGSIQVQ